MYLLHYVRIYYIFLFYSKRNFLVPLSNNIGFLILLNIKLDRKMINIFDTILAKEDNH